MTEKITTLHPDGKKGVNIEKRKYEIIKETILKLLKEQTYSFKELDELVKQELRDSFEGSIGWYFTTVKLDLEARNLIQRIGMSPQKLALC